MSCFTAFNFISLFICIVTTTPAFAENSPEPVNTPMGGMLTGTSGISYGSYGMGSPVASELNEDQKKAKESLDLKRKTVQSQLCAQQINDARKTIHDLEAQSCLDCIKDQNQKSSGLQDTVKKIENVVRPLDFTNQKTRAMRDLAFLRQAHTTGIFPQKLDPFEQAKADIANMKSGVETFTSVLKSGVESQQQFLAMMKLLEEGQPPSPSSIDSLKLALMNSGVSPYPKDAMETAIKQMEEAVSKSGFSIDHPSKSAEKNYIQQMKANLQASEALSLIDDLKNATPSPDSEAYKAIFSTLKSKLKMSRQSLPAYEAALNQQKQLLKQKTAELETLMDKKKSKRPKAYDQSDATELARFEDAIAQLLKSSIARNTGFNDCGMSAGELYALTLYTGSGYGILNSALRMGGESAEKQKPFRDALDSALKKLRRFNGEVRRGTTVNPSELEKYREGEVVTFPAFTSTSLGSGWNGNIKFVIRSVTGRYVGSLSSVYGEDEVLFPAGAKFKVLARKDVSGVAEVTLAEIDPKIRPGRK
jgi:hypothetical protein